jgi:Uma2 family endonuclease
MSTAARISLEEYLGTHYEPECELIDGILISKPMGTLEHMDMERRLTRLLERFEEAGLGRAVHELSIRFGSNFRIPDLAFVAAGARFEKGILLDPPLLCVEVLSPSQNPSELFAKCEAYHQAGVPYCWVIDPLAKAAWEYHKDAPLQSAGDTLRAGPLSVTTAELFPKNEQRR